MQPSVHRRMTAQNDSNVNTQVWAVLTSVPLWALPKNFSYLQKLSQSSQIVPSPTIKSSLLSLSDTSLHELSAAEGHASAYFQDRWYVNPLDLPTKPFSVRTPPTSPFIPDHICASFPRCQPANHVLPRGQIAPRFRVAVLTHCYQNTTLLEKGLFMLLLFSR